MWDQFLQVYWTLLLRSLGQTLLLTLLFTFLCVFFIGLLFGLLNVSKNKALNIIGTVYVDGIRAFR